MGDAGLIKERIQRARERAGLIGERAPEPDVEWVLADGQFVAKPRIVQETPAPSQDTPAPSQRPLPKPVAQPYYYED